MWQIILTIFVVGPYLLIIIFDKWYLRMSFGLALFIAVPLISLYCAVNPKIKVTKYDPKSMPKERFILRNLGLVLRVGMALFAIFLMTCVTVPYTESVLKLFSKQHDLYVVKGRINRITGSFPGSLGLRGFWVEGQARKVVLIFPIGKRPRPGAEYVFLLLPGTDWAVDVKKAEY